MNSIIANNIYLIGFLSSLTLCIFIKKFSQNKINLEFKVSKKIQDINKSGASRLGGVGIFLSLILSWTIYGFTQNIDGLNVFLILLVVSTPSFLIGLLDDILDKITPIKRLLTTFISSLIAIYSMMYYLDFNISNDKFFIFDVLFCILLLTFLPHMFNLIDGINGLSASVGIIVLISIIYLFNIKLNLQTDTFLKLAICSIIPFLIINLITTKLFLGDSGAYFIGFICSYVIGLYLIESERFNFLHAILILFYPMFETVFTCYRRIIDKKPIFQPDTQHLHSNIYKLVKKKFPKYKYSNSICFIFILPLVCVGPIFLYNFNINNKLCFLMIIIMSFFFFFIFNTFRKLKF